MLRLPRGCVHTLSGVQITRSPRCFSDNAWFAGRIMPNASIQPVVLSSIVITANILALCWFGLRDRKPLGALQVTASSAWGENRFSSATSGKLFQMRAWRRFGGVRAFELTGLDAIILPEVSQFKCPSTTWAVVTTISSPTTTVLQLAKLAEEEKLCLVVVGDRKTPANYTLGSNSVYLSPTDQEKLPYAIIKHLPWSHFGRKNIGFLYAIHHGAEYVYDTDDDNELAGFGSLERTDPGRVGVPKLEPNRCKTFDTDHYVLNPYPCFASEESESHLYAFSWPRGLPLENIKDPRTVSCAMHDSSQREFGSVAVIQSLADHDPDVDAIYRLTRPLPISFRSLQTNDAAILPRGTFTPYNAQATLYERRAMWGLLLPITVHGRVSDIWRSYFTQSLMWPAGLTLAMARPWVVQKRNAHNYLGDLQAEQNLYYQAGALVQYLSTAFDAVAATTMPDLIKSLYVDMYEHGIVEIGDVKLAQAWLSDLRSVAYNYPSVRLPDARAATRSSAGKGVAEVEGPISTASGTVFRRPKAR